MMYSSCRWVWHNNVTQSVAIPPPMRKYFWKYRGLRGWQKRFQPPQPEQISHLSRWLFALFCKAFRPVRVSQIKNILSPPFTRTSYNEFPYFSSIYAILAPKYYKLEFWEKDGLYFIKEKSCYSKCDMKSICLQ